MTGINFTLFLLAALVIAAVPGPGIFYVAARTLSGGSKAGIASTLGTALGGLVHVTAGALGVSAIILASAELFTAVKVRRRTLSDLAWPQDVSRCRHFPAATSRRFRSATGFPGRHTGRSVESQDCGVLSGLHSSVPGSGRRRSRAPVHHAGSDLGDIKHACRFHRGGNGLDRASEPVAPPATVSAPEAGFGTVHRRARNFAGAGTAACELGSSPSWVERTCVILRCEPLRRASKDDLPAAHPSRRASARTSG
jgi:hypothetical protein